MHNQNIVIYFELDPDTLKKQGKTQTSARGKGRFKKANCTGFCRSGGLINDIESGRYIQFLLDGDDETIWLTSIRPGNYTTVVGMTSELKMKNKYWGSKTEIPFSYVAHICSK